MMRIGQTRTKSYAASDGTVLLAWGRDFTAFGQADTELGPAPTGLRARSFTYDQAARLTGVSDATGVGCSFRSYGFDAASDRVSKTQATTLAPALCPTAATTPDTTTTGVFNTAAQLMSSTVTGAGAGTGAYTYDGLGRSVTVPAVDTGTPATGSVGLTYWATDKMATQTWGTTTQSNTLDPTGRVDTITTTNAGASATTSLFYAGPGDSPAWTSTSTGWDWYIPAPAGGMAIEATGTGTTTATATLVLSDFQGSITATIPNTSNVTANQISAISINDEYGQPLTTDQPTPYQWLGTSQRSNQNQAGLLSMGARVYNPATGRFLTLDPVPGGNPNPYTWPTDPINQTDLTGNWPDWGSIIRTVVAAAAPVRAVVNIAHQVAHAVTRAVTRIPRATRAAVRNAGRLVKSTANATATRKPGGDGVVDWFTNRNWGHVTAAVASVNEGLAAISAGVGIIGYGAGRGLADENSGGAAIAVGVGAIIYGQFLIFGSAAEAYRGFNEPCPQDGCGPVSQIGEFWDRTLSGFSFRRPELR